jgi:hypothetical protein
LWEESLTILNELLEKGVHSGELRQCDTWEVANILWTLANALIQSESTLARRKLRRSTLEQSYSDAIGLILRGLENPPEKGVS